MALVGFVGAILTSNACGLFADGCSDSGETGDGFSTMLLVLAASVPTGIAGIALCVSSVRSTR